MNKELLTGRNGLPVPGWNGIDGEKTVVIMAHGFGSAKEGVHAQVYEPGLEGGGHGLLRLRFPCPRGQPS